MRLAFADPTTAGNQLREQARKFMRRTFAEIGVEMTINNPPPAVTWGDHRTLSQFETAIAGVAIRPDARDQQGGSRPDRA